MAEYRISEVAERTGFSPSTLRFYEEVGLVIPAGRSDNGYRRYDDRDVERLRMVARSKQLGLTLEEITGLVEFFPREECATVQERLRELLVAKRRDLIEQIAELERLSAELVRVSDRLGLPAPAGACGDSCACFSETDADPAAPIACSLDAEERTQRFEAWQRLAVHVVDRVELPDGVRLRFAKDVSAAEIADLAAQEHVCCSFFRFSIGIGDDTTLDITAPTEARDVIDALLAAP